MDSKYLSASSLGVLFTVIFFTILMAGSAWASGGPQTANVTWYNHSTFMIQYNYSGMKTIYIDVGDQAVLPATPVQADVILITHNHTDHFNLTEIAKINNNDTWVIGPMDDANISVDYPGNFTVNKTMASGLFSLPPPYPVPGGVGANITPIHAYNTNHDIEETIGYIVELPGGISLYFSGDTDCHTDLKDDLTEYGEVTAVFIVIDSEYNMGPGVAASCAENDILSHTVTPMHYSGTDPSLFVGNISDPSIVRTFEIGESKIFETAIYPGCDVWNDSSACDLDDDCTWDNDSNMCQPDCGQKDNTTTTACETHFAGSICKYDVDKCEFKPFDLTDFGCGVTNVTDTESACNAEGNCTWDLYAPDGGACIIDCFQYDGNSSGCNGAFLPNEYNMSLCNWKHNPASENPDEGICDPFFFDQSFSGASPCFEFDGNKTGCDSLQDECSWFLEPDCPSGEPCEDINGTEHGWCDPQGKFDFSEKPCWQMDGNKSGCGALKDEYLWPCEWFPDPWGEDKTGEGGGWCDMAFYGGAGGCWDFFDEASCGNAGDIGCTWENDTFSTAGGFCREQGCWDFDNFNASVTINQSEACSNFSASISFFNCTWEGDPPGNETIGFCYEDWKDFDCGSNNNNSKACFDTFYCVWNDQNKTCIDPIGGPGFFGPNPGCFILPQGKCEEVSTCEWNATTSCESNSTNPVGPMGIQCSDINNSAFCSNIPFLSSCCKWNATASNNTCVEAQYSTACWDNMQEPPEGAHFCEDYNAINNETLCNDIADDPWYMPCKWDNSTTPEECRFAFDDMFEGKDLFDMGFDDLSKTGCDQIGGVWFQEKWTDPQGYIFIDEWCEVGMGKGYDSCDTSCWACEYKVDGSDWDSSNATDRADMKTACENSNASDPYGCKFIPDNNSINSIGWCDVNFTFGNFSAFEFEDCFTPWADSDGDSLLPDEDPDCFEFFKWGYIEAETGYECKDGIDNDGNNLTDCQDPSCKFDPFYGQHCTPGNDTEAPEVEFLAVDTYPDGAFFDIVTNEPTNATILFYYNDSNCSIGNETSILDPKLNNTDPISGVNKSWMEVDDYDIWHGIPVDNVSLTALGNATLQSNKTYYYKISVYDRAGNNTRSACRNFTTLASESNFTVGFKLPPPVGDAKDILGLLEAQFDWDGDGTFEENQTSDSDKKKVNNSKAKKINIKFSNPNATKQWGITLIGANFKDQDGSRVLNISDAFVVNETGGDIRVGMKKSKWSEIAQKLGVDYVKIIIPKGSNGLTNSKLKHCPDNATSLSDSRCIDVNLSKVDCTIWPFNTTCDIPTTIGFSVFGVAGTVEDSGNGGSPGGGSPAADSDVTENATVIDGKATVTFSKIAAGKTGTMVIPDTADVPFKELAIKVKNKVLSIAIEVYKLDEKPSDITEDISTGVIQSYIQIDENIQAADIDTVTISFKVPVSWINDNSIDKATVVLNRYADGKWTALTTTKSSEDSDYVYYSGNSPGLSRFGISGQGQAVTTTTTLPVTVTTTVPATTAPPATPTTTAPPTTPAPKKGICGPTSVLLIAMLFPALSYIRRKSR